MAKKKQFTKMRCDVCKSINYYTNKSKESEKEKLALKKFCKVCKKHTLHKEAKR